MSKTYLKTDPDTLETRQSFKTLDNEGWYRSRDVVEIFNFRARQKTTVVESLIWNKTHHNQSLANAAVTQNFADIEGREDVAAAHAKLVEMGGTPPPLAEILPRMDKPKLRTAT